MEILGTLPVWIQLVIAVLVAGVLVVMNIGWLIQARGWLEQQRQKQRGGAGTAKTEAPKAGPTGRSGL